MVFSSAGLQLSLRSATVFGGQSILHLHSAAAFTPPTDSDGTHRPLPTQERDETLQFVEDELFRYCRSVVAVMRDTHVVSTFLFNMEDPESVAKQGFTLFFVVKLSLSRECDFQIDYDENGQNPRINRMRTKRKCLREQTGERVLILGAWIFFSIIFFHEGI
jgi:hypothetical protein